jgi:hypothetical protein
VSEREKKMEELKEREHIELLDFNDINYQS